MPQVNPFKYIGIIFSSNIGWEEKVNYASLKAWKSLHFIMRISENSSDK